MKTPKTLTQSPLRVLNKFVTFLAFNRSEKEYFVSKLTSNAF